MLSYSLNSLLVFCMVVKSRSFAKAAGMLSMTQPGVSNHVTQLEMQVGSSLLVRGKGKFALTKQGKRIFKYAEKIEKAAAELQESIRQIHQETKPMLRIGCTTSYSRVIMPYLLGSFQNTYPNIMIKLDAGSSEEMVDSLLTMRNDVAIVSTPIVSRKIYSVPLAREELVLITGRDHKLGRGRSVSLSDIEKYPLIIREEGSATRKTVLNALASLNITPSVLIEAKSTEFIKEWVSQGKGVSILIKRAVTDEESRHLKVIPLKEPLFLEISVMLLRSKRYDVSIQKFMSHVSELRLKPPEHP